MDHDSLAVAKALSFTRKKELVAFYTSNPMQESMIKKIKEKCETYFIHESRKIIPIDQVKKFCTEFQEKERLERKEREELKRKAQEVHLTKKSQKKTVIDLDEETLTTSNEDDYLKSRVAALEKELFDTRQELHFYKNFYNSIKKKLAKFSKFAPY